MFLSCLSSAKLVLATSVNCELLGYGNIVQPSAIVWVTDMPSIYCSVLSACTTLRDVSSGLSAFTQRRVIRFRIHAGCSQRTIRFLRTEGYPISHIFWLSVEGHPLSHTCGLCVAGHPIRHTCGAFVASFPLSDSRGLSAMARCWRVLARWCRRGGDGHWRCGGYMLALCW